MVEVMKLTYFCPQNRNFTTDMQCRSSKTGKPCYILCFHVAKSGRAKHSCGPRRPKSGRAVPPGPIASAAYACMSPQTLLSSPNHNIIGFQLRLMMAYVAISFFMFVNFNDSLLEHLM